MNSLKSFAGFFGPMISPETYIVVIAIASQSGAWNDTFRRFDVVVMTETLQALQGKVTGARINMNTGAPGGGGQIQIRGTTSILGNGEPLFVIDGVIMSNASIAGGSNTLTRRICTGAGEGLDGVPATAEMAGPAAGPRQPAAADAGFAAAALSRTSSAQ